MDMFLAWRQSTQEVHDPENRVIPKGEPGPTLSAPVGDHGDHNTEETHSHGSYADRSEEQCVTGARPYGDNQSEYEDCRSGYRE